MPDCTTCRWLDTFTPRSDEPSSHGCKAPIDGGCYVLDVTKPPCVWGKSRPMSYSERKTT